MRTDHDTSSSKGIRVGADVLSQRPAGRLHALCKTLRLLGLLGLGWTALSALADSPLSLNGSDMDEKEAVTTSEQPRTMEQTTAAVETVESDEGCISEHELLETGAGKSGRVCSTEEP